MNFKYKTGFINLRISNENKYKLSLNMYCLRRWGQWKRQSPCKAGARPTPAQFHFDQWNVNTNTNVLFNVNQWMINTDHKLQQQEKTTWKNNKKRVNKWIVHFIVHHDAEWKKWRRIFTGLASIWRNQELGKSKRQIQKACVYHIIILIVPFLTKKIIILRITGASPAFRLVVGLPWPHSNKA